MAFAHGRLTVFKINAVDMSAWTDNTDFTDEADVHDTTTYGKSAHTKAPGLLNGAISVGGTYDAAVSAIEATVRPLIGTTTAIELGPEGSTSGKKKFTGNAVVKNFNTSHPVAGMVKWKADLEITDVITVGTYP